MITLSNLTIWLALPPHMVPNEADKVKRLMNGLRPQIKLKFLTERIKTTKDVIDRVTAVEDHWLKNKMKKENFSKDRDEQGPSKK